MKKLFCLMLMAVATVLFVSCNKITENKLIGRWNVVSWTSYYIEENETYENAEDVGQLIFYDNGIWELSDIDDPHVLSFGKWYLDNDKLHFMYNEVWDVKILSKKEIQLHCIGTNDIIYGIEETVRLRKAN